MHGGPDGGDGGRGGSVYLYADSGLSTLQSFRGRARFVAKRGGDGLGKRKHGADGEDVEIRVPVGTVVLDVETEEVIADLDVEGTRFLAARGGRGGKGNVHFATATRQAPDFAQPGQPGQELTVRLTLKLIADVGLVGLPNAGKSSFIRRISGSKARVGAYPFTTLSPNLGVVGQGTRGRFVVADIPGLIRGAHEGAGLGDQFLRHVERTQLLVHIVAIAPGEDPVASYRTVADELCSYSPELASRPTLVVLNKIDLVPRGERAAVSAPLKRAAEEAGHRFQVMSCFTGEGVRSFLRALEQAVADLKPPPEPEPYDPMRDEKTRRSRRTR